MSAAPQAAAAPAPAPPRRRWLRRAAFLAVVLLALRGALGLALEPALVAAARAGGLDLTVAEIDLELFDGALEVRTLEARLADDPGAAPLLRLDHLRFDADVSALFSGALRVHRVAVDGLEVELVRRADGSWNLPSAGGSDGPSEPEGGPQAEEPEPLDPDAAPFPLHPPVVVDALRAQGVVLRLRDEVHDEGVARELRLDLRVTDFGAAERPARIRAQGHGPGWLDALRLDLDAARRDDGATAVEGEAVLNGLHLERLERLLATVGVEPLARQLDGAAHVSIALEPATDVDGGPLAVSAALTDVRLVADLEPEFELDVASLVVPHWSQASIEGARVVVRGVRGGAARGGDGRLVVAGLALGGERPDAGDGNDAPDAERGAGGGPAPAIVDAGLAVEDVELTWRDDALATGPVEVALVLRRLGIEHLDLPLVPGGRPLAVALELRGGDGVGDAEAAGTLAPHAGGFEAELVLNASDLTLAAVAPYLEAAGLRSTLTAAAGGARLTASAEWTDAATVVDARLEGARVVDGDVELFAWERAALEGLTLPADGPARLGRVTVDGLSLPFERTGSGGLAVAGLLVPGPPGAALPPLRSALHLERLTVDETFEADARVLAVEAVGDVDGAVGRATLDGQIALDAANGSTELRLELEAADLSTRLAGPLLAPAGIEPVFDGASLEGAVALRLDADGSFAASLSDLRFGTVDEAWLSLAALAVERVDLGGDAPLVGPIDVRSPRLAARRDAAGAWHALGLRFAPPPAADGGASEPAPAAAAPDGEPDAAPAVAADAPARLDALPIPALRFEGLSIADGALAVRDGGGRVREPVEHTLAFAATVEPFTTGPGAEPFAATLRASAPGLLDRAEVDVAARLDPGAASVRASLVAAGVRADGLAPLLPPGVEATVDAFALDTSFRASAASAAEGGLVLDVAFESLDLRDGGGAALASARGARLLAPRIDVADRVYRIEELSVDGVAVDVVALDDGALELAGLRLAGPPPDEVAAVGSTPPEPQGGSPTNGTPASAPMATGAAPPPTVRVERLSLELGAVTFRGAPLGDGEPLVIGGSLRSAGPLELLGPEPSALPPLALEARLVADTATLAADVTLEPFAGLPRVVVDLSLTGVRGDRIRALAPALMDRVDPDALGEGRLSATLTAEFDLRRRTPTSLDLRDGFGAQVVLADLDWRDATDDERLLGLDELRVELTRYRPGVPNVEFALIELSEPFLRARRVPEGIDALGVRLLTPPPADGDGLERHDPLADGAVDGADIAAIGSPRGTPHVGDDPPLAPRGSAPLDDPETVTSLSALGSTTPPVDVPLSGGEPAEGIPTDVASAVDDDGAAAAEMPPPYDTTTGDSPAGEVRVDQLLITGLDAELIDATVDPPARIPLRALDVEVKGLTTLAAVEPRPIRFSAYLGAGDVELPVPVRARGGLLGGIASGIASGITTAITGGEGEVETELRPLFTEIGASGQVTLAPTLDGWVRAHAMGVELLGLRGLARSSGVEIGGGTVDLNTRVRFGEGGRTTVDSTAVLADLSVSEPVGGPISRWLRLPAPLDSVVFLLKNRSGEVRLPLGFQVDSGRVGTGALLGAATSALARVIADAVASSPLRVTGTLTDLIGLTGGSGGEDEPATFQLEFPPGSTVLEPAALAAIDEARRALEDNEDLELVVAHQLGERDRERTAVLANPGPRVTRELAERVSRRLAGLHELRRALAAEARTALLAATEARAVEAAAELRACEDAIGRAEAALDDLLGRLRPGDERRRPRRERAAALELAELRQAAVVEALLAVAPDLGARIDPRRPRLDPDDAPERGRTQLVLRRRN